MAVKTPQTVYKMDIAALMSPIGCEVPLKASNIFPIVFLVFETECVE